MSRASVLTGRLRRRSRERAVVTDYRTPPGGNPLYVSRLFAAQADAEQAKNRPLTPAEQRQLEDELRAGIERHAVRTPAGDERSVTEAIAAVPDPDWASMPVPAAQAEAVRAASGPQPALRDFPDGARPAEDVPLSWPRGQHPYPQEPQPSFTAHAAGRWSGSRLTQEYTPDFAEATRRARPYAAPGSTARHLLPALDAGTQMLPPAIGDDLAAAWPGPGESGEQPLDAWHEMCAVRYPGRNLNATFGDYAGVLGKVNEITGTHGTSRWPLQALPAADPRWAALAADALDAARQFGDDDPVQAAAYRRLHGYVTAAPDCETAVRLAELAAEAGIIARKLPAAMREQRDAA